MNLLAILRDASDESYAAFQAKLTPTLDRSRFLGVRVPVARKLAKQLVRANEYEPFLEALPHNYYDENVLHGLILSEIKDFDVCLREVNRFLPYVDNWAVCDTLSPRCFSKNKEALLEQIRFWAASSETYTARFGIEMLMSHFLDEAFQPEFLEIPARVTLTDYYAKMMVAWFFATALAKQWDSALPYLIERRLSEWTHNKTIQKGRESFRITEEQKEFLNTLKR